MQVTVKGKASGKLTQVTYAEVDLDKDLLHFLRANGVTIASSCDGEGVCKKCVIQNDWLTCRLTVREFLALVPTGVIEVSYL